jgi:hypothetical protein
MYCISSSSTISTKILRVKKILTFGNALSKFVHTASRQYVTYYMPYCRYRFLNTEPAKIINNYKFSENSDIVKHNGV